MQRPGGIREWGSACRIFDSTMGFPGEGPAPLPAAKRPRTIEHFFKSNAPKTIPHTELPAARTLTPRATLCPQSSTVQPVIPTMCSGTRTDCAPLGAEKSSSCIQPNDTIAGSVTVDGSQQLITDLSSYLSRSMGPAVRRAHACLGGPSSCTICQSQDAECDAPHTAGGDPQLDSKGVIKGSQCLGSSNIDLDVGVSTPSMRIAAHTEAAIGSVNQEPPPGPPAVNIRIENELIFSSSGEFKAEYDKKGTRWRIGSLKARVTSRKTQADLFQSLVAQSVREA
jgi:hypothetical protein